MRLRPVLATLLVLAATHADAQVQVRGVMLPVPPLPPIGLPLPHIGLPDTDEPATPTSTGPERRQGRDRHPQHGGAVGPVFVYSPVIIEADRSPARGETSPSTAREPRQPELGTVELAVSGSDRYLVFVDGYFAGAGEQLGRWLSLEPGPHDIELRAEGFRANTFKVRIASGQTLTYTHAFVREDAATTPAISAAPAAAPIGVVYVIAGCYAGNVPPAKVTLPAGCDPALVQTLDR